MRSRYPSLNTVLLRRHHGFPPAFKRFLTGGSVLQAQPKLVREMGRLGAATAFSQKFFELINKVNHIIY